MMTYEETMRFGAAQYADVIAALSACGLPAEFTQTGGMCAAIEVTLEAGYYLLLTDREDTLSWNRAEHEGWFVGLYEPEERRTADGPLRYRKSEDGSPAAALALVGEVLPGRSSATADAHRHTSTRPGRPNPRHGAYWSTPAAEGPTL